MCTWDDIVKWATAQPETTVESWYGTPGLKVAGKGFARFRSDDEGGVVVFCTPEDKVQYLASGDRAYFTTPHYNNWATVLIDLDEIEWSRLQVLLQQSRRLKLPKRMLNSESE